MGKLSRDKGKAGEREVVHLMRKYGFEARRGQQFRGTKDSPDVVHNMKGFFAEVKRREQVNLYKTLEKADEEKPEGDISIVFHRKDRARWLVTLDAEDFLRMLQEKLDETNVL